jgi:hypothetical protein
MAARRSSSTDVLDPAYIDPALDARAATFENPTGARGAGGSAAGGRKGAPSRRLRPGERVVVADIEGPGVVRHIWMTFPPALPPTMRAMFLELFYDGAAQPSASVPCLDFFGLAHGRPVAYHSAFMAVNEGRGFNSYLPMPFRRGLRIEVVNGSERTQDLYYQVDYTLEAEVPPEHGYLHVGFRRENPTTMRRDFVVADGFHGPGRFLGCAMGVRIIDPGDWYGEGEMKLYRDGDGELPTICGTGLEDYVGSAWGLGPHAAPYGGAPLVVQPPGADPARSMGANPDFVSFYRWHLHDPLMFQQSMRVTIQQIGAAFFRAGEEERFAAYQQTNPAAGNGWVHLDDPRMLAWGIAERVDDVCATAYVYCREPQPVSRLDVAAAVADIERRPYEPALAMERMLG